jgi:energy-converting hydrogenase Eha subunit B
VLQGQPASPSLADDGALRAVLDRVGRRNGVYVTSDLTAPPSAAAPPGALLAGLGMDLVDGGTAGNVVVAVVFASSEEAEAARDGYEEVLATGTSAVSGEAYTDLLGDVELSVEGPVVVTRWRSATPAMRLVTARDLPLLWSS